jgi:hypothetical protein
MRRARYSANLRAAREVVGASVLIDARALLVFGSGICSVLDFSLVLVGREDRQTH